MTGSGYGGLAGLPTGPGLCRRLALLEPAAVPDEQLLELLSAEWRQLAYQQARVWAVMAEIATRDPMPQLPPAARWSGEQIFESAVDEVRAELLLTRRAARRELDYADSLTRLPQIARALAEGRIDRARAIAFLDGCLELTDQQAERLVAELLPGAGQVTVTGLAERIRRVAIALDPAWAEHRYRHAVRDRKVVGYLNRDGSAVLAGQNLPADDAACAGARVDALADAAKRAGAAARIDHLRAEVFLGLLDGRFHGMTQQDIITELKRLYPKDTSVAADPTAGPVNEPPDHQPAEQPAAAQPDDHPLAPPARSATTRSSGRRPRQSPRRLACVRPPTSPAPGRREIVTVEACPAPTYAPDTRGAGSAAATPAPRSRTTQIGEFTAGPDPPPVLRNLRGPVSVDHSGRVL